MNIKKSFFLASLLIIIITIFFGIPQLLREKNTEKNQLLFDQSIAQLKEFLLTNPNSEEIGNFFQKITRVAYKSKFWMYRHCSGKIKFFYITHL